MKNMRFLCRLFTVIPVFAMADSPRLVRTGHRAIATTDARIVFHRNQPVGPLRGSTRRTHRHTGRFCTMLAADNHEQPLDIGERPAFNIKYLAPLHTGRGVIGMLAGNRAGLTADATVQIDHHPIAGRVRGASVGSHTACLSLSIFRILIRARSALEPVESVSDSASDVTELRLGKFRSFAYGVAQ